MAIEVSEVGQELIKIAQGQEGDAGDDPEKKAAAGEGDAGDDAEKKAAAGEGDAGDDAEKKAAAGEGDPDTGDDPDKKAAAEDGDAETGGKKSTINWQDEAKKLQKRNSDQQSFFDQQIAALAAQIEELKKGQPAAPAAQPTLSPEELEKKRQLDAEIKKVTEDPVLAGALKNVANEIFGPQFKALEQAIQVGYQGRTQQIRQNTTKLNADVLTEVKKIHEDVEDILASEAYREWFAQQDLVTKMAAMGPQYNNVGQVVFPGGGVNGGVWVLNRFKEDMAAAAGNGNGGGDLEQKKRQEELEKAAAMRRGTGGKSAGPAEGGLMGDRKEFVDTLLAAEKKREARA